MADKKNLHVVVDDAGLDELDVRDRENIRQLEITRWRMQIAFLIVGTVMFVFAAAFITDVVFQYREKAYIPPAFFVEMCRIAITAGVGILGVGALAALNTNKSIQRRNKAIEDNCKTDESDPPTLPGV